MARFIFKLEPVLRQRKAIEREKQLALAELERSRVELEDQIRQIQGRLRAEKDTMRDQLTPGARVDLRGVRMQAGAQLRLVLEAQQAVFKLAGVHRRVEAARAELIEATKARRAVELLRERRFEQWLEEQRRKEASMLDEIAVVRGGRTEPNAGHDVGRAA
jgi:flagellar FliJ protein